jgi:hypothetical protein
MVVLHIAKDEAIVLGVPNRAFGKAEAGGQSLDRDIACDNVLEARMPDVKQCYINGLHGLPPEPSLKWRMLTVTRTAKLEQQPIENNKLSR